jgi:ribosomal protein S18 acetylase RimI-like enzyme
MGLASALITRSLETLKEAGMAETELGVDAENESAAFRLYEHLGFKTFYTDFWFRKLMV